jgi:hypothetical protein
MTAVHRSIVPQPRPIRKAPNNSRGLRPDSPGLPVVKGQSQSTQRQIVQGQSSTVTSFPMRNVEQKVEKLNNMRQQGPVWLKTLLFVQRSSDVITFLLIAATLALYSWTVYTQQQWTKEYDKLQTLQRNERQLTTTNEGIKNQLAQQAEKPETGMVAPDPRNTIYLQPAPQRQVHPPVKTVEPEPATKAPLGY